MNEIRLLKFGFPEVFEIHPQLKEIWRPDLSSAMQEVTIADIIEDSSADIYLIMKNDKVIGITGFYVIDNECIGLRWHGIIPEYRNKGYSREAFNQLVKVIEEKYPHALGIVEFAEADDETYPSIHRHFKALEFEETTFRYFSQADMFPFVPDTGKPWIPLIRYINGYNYGLAHREYNRREITSSITGVPKTRTQLNMGVRASLKSIGKLCKLMLVSTPNVILPQYNAPTFIKSKPYLKKKKGRS